MRTNKVKQSIFHLLSGQMSIFLQLISASRTSLAPSVPRHKPKPPDFLGMIASAAQLLAVYQTTDIIAAQHVATQAQDAMQCERGGGFWPRFRPV